jgi:two-component system, cell cycle response regulator
MDSSFKILIADDSAVYRKLLEQQVFSLGPASVLVTKSVQEALELFERERPDLIIADWVMPDATGIELCQRIREAAKSSYTYIIILTSKSEKRDLVKALSAGADDYLTKPFDPDELLARARVGLRLIDLHRQIETQNRLLEELALTDPLTNLPNRRAVVNWSERQLGGSARHKFPLWLVLVDLDHFKSVNDNYGHGAGDAVLRRFGEILRVNTRCCDICGRMGGEEFLQVLTHSDEEGIRICTERLRNQFAAEEFRFGGASVTVTASVGVAGFRGNEKAPEFGELLKLADAALYRAKKLGRNRVQFEIAEHEAAPIT